MERMKEKWRRIRQYDEIASISTIARRYFAMNAFDGVLTIIGVLMGTLTAKVADPRIVLTTGLATSISMGVSGLWGAYLTENAERKIELTALGRQTLTDLSQSRIGRASRFAVIIVSLVDGLSPLLAAVLVLLPFFFVSFFSSILWAYYASLALALLVLFALGIYLGHISQENVYYYGIKTVIAGLVSILLSRILTGSG